MTCFHWQIICGPDLQFYEIISRWPGATNENKIFNISEIHQRFDYNKMEGILLANCNYVNSSFVLTPINVVTHEKQMKYNEAHMRTYAIWDAINLWKRRFKCLQTLLNHKEGRYTFNESCPAHLDVFLSFSYFSLQIQFKQSFVHVLHFIT